MHRLTGKPQACKDFRSQFFIHCKTRCGRRTRVKTKKQGPRQNHRTGCLQRSLEKSRDKNSSQNILQPSPILLDSSPFLWENHGLSLLIAKCVISRHTWSDTRCLCGILHSVSAHRTLSVCFLAVRLFASLVLPDRFLPPSIIAHVFFYFYCLYKVSPPLCCTSATERMDPMCKGHLVGNNERCGFLLYRNRQN